MRWTAVLTLVLALAAPAMAQETLNLPIGKYADFATSSDEKSLTDQDDPVMRKWVDNNIENIVKVVSVDRAGARAIVSFASAKMTLPIPLGWYAMDDGERGAAFTADEDIRIIARQLDLEFEGMKSIEDYAAVKRAIQQQRAPRARIAERRLAGGQVMNIYENVPPRANDRGPRTIYEVLTAHPTDKKRGHQILLGVPDGQGIKYLPLLGLIMQDAKIGW
ncbi:MAG: hypothetical protein K0S54_1233 [Alphaproteobacteria bacterium]|jgi:hypothetical protein|nr:hypothetical protein [Alphaproteobacteria bacterium]